MEQAERSNKRLVESVERSTAFRASKCKVAIVSATLSASNTNSSHHRSATEHVTY